MRFKVGDKVSFDARKGIIFGTVVDISIGWRPTKYYVEFKANKRGLKFTMWMEGEELTLVPDKEQVVFT